ncbi:MULTISPECIES: PAS domain S-box protein [unclassified Leptolyngbya]|uniref:PAS domain S-box protein n=1 Tax=unclassified Leptolyngbya TaxID=2650499 RepID=UPI001682B4CF|nr:MULTISPECIES: PAS domain S-box protein [unclassified Leptolyngbya]MBD1913973.1 PAS domain S-box protein [Leptolyngbya sp. FACHB-8]MBD2155940.1 PAS domain S-box protein [Leptolyngbya sp. FACHB-16]
MSAYRRFPLIGAVFGSATIATILILEIWHFWTHREAFCEAPSILTMMVLLGTVGGWAIAFMVYLRQQTTSIQALNRQLHHEIAQRKLIEQDLRESEERWQLALRGNNDGIWDWNVQTNDVFFSSRWKEMLGFADHEIANHIDEWSKRVHPDDLGWVTQAIQDHFAKKTPFYITEHRVLCKDGSYKWILDRGQALWDDAGRVVRMTGSHTDITEQKQTEVGLRESEERYRRLIQNLNAGFVIHRTATQILMCNQIACDLLGLSMGSLGKDEMDPTWHFTDEDGLPIPPDCHPVNQVLATRAPLKNVVLGIQQAEKPPRWLLANAFPEFDQNHQLLQVVVTFIDINEQQAALRERKRMELERQTAENALRQSEATKQAIIEAIPDLLIHMRSDGSYVDFMSKNGFDHLYPNQIAASATLNKVLPPHLAQLRLESIHQALQSHELQVYEHEFLLGGQQRHEELRVVPLPQHDVLVMVRDITARKQAEAELQAQKNFLQQVIDAVPSSIFVKDQQGKFLIVNQAASAIYGIPISEMLGKQDCDFNENLLQSKEFASQNQAVIQNLTPITFPDQEIQDRYGMTRWYQTTISPFTNADGHVRGIIGNAIDVSDRKHAETNLQFSEERLKLALDASQDGLWDWNMQTGDIYHSDRYLEILEYQPGEVLLDLPSWKETIHPDDQAEVLRCLTAHLHDHSHTYTCDYRVRCKSGTWKWITDYGKVVVHDANGKPLRMIGAYRDISDRKQAEAELRHQKEIFQAIVNHIPFMIVLFNGEGQVELVNPELEKVLGWSLADWQHLDTPAQHNSSPDARHQMRAHRLAASGKWHDFTIQTASGRNLDISWANVQLSNGHSLGIGQDVSDRKRRESALRQAVEAAEAANLAKSLFLANMSHELRTPLNVILGFAQVMTHDPALTLPQQSDLQTIRRSGDHLLNLINDVLDLSKIEAGYSTIDLSGFDFIALLHSLRTMLAERATAKGLLLFFDIAPEVPQFILSDIQKLRQILLNLLSNAIKFTDRGSVTLQVRIKEPTRGRVAEWPGGDAKSRPYPSTYPLAPAPLTLQVTIIDTGPGIAEDELTTIFDAFVQAKAGRQSASGTGLGLSISRKLLELMEGRITVRSTLGQGSTFTLTLPVQPCSGVSVVPEASDRIVIGLTPGQPLRRILVVDDQLENRTLMMRLLSQPGLEVREASNGEDAIHLWQEWYPDLTWMDVRMPGMDGYEATRQIRALEQGANSIIIALTAQASQSDRTLALAAGCDDYISKPFREETLFLKMREYLGLEYIYAEPDVAITPFPAASPHANEPYVALLTSQPASWLEALEDAAICGNDRAIAELVAQLPTQATQLATFLLDLVDQFAFEHILHLLHQPVEH